MTNRSQTTKRRQLFISISVLSILACAVYFLAVPTFQANAKKKANSTMRLATVTFPTSSALPAPVPDANAAGLTLNYPVSGLTDQLRGVALNIQMNPAHTWLGDLTMTLNSPAPVNSHLILRRVGSTSGTNTGDSSVFGGPYTFTDGTTGDFWTVANGTAFGVPVVSGSYRTLACCAPLTGPGIFTKMNPVFQGPVLFEPGNAIEKYSGGKSQPVPTDNVANGTWTLNVVDDFLGDTGSVSATSITLTTLAPTAATTGIRGSVLNSSNQPVIRAQVTIFDTQTGESLTSSTNQFGLFRFEDLPVGHFYIMTVEHKQYQFESQSFTLDDAREVNFRSDQK